MRGIPPHLSLFPLREATAATSCSTFWFSSLHFTFLRYEHFANNPAANLAPIPTSRRTSRTQLSSLKEEAFWTPGRLPPPHCTATILWGVHIFLWLGPGLRTLFFWLYRHKIFRPESVRVRVVAVLPSVVAVRPLHCLFGSDQAESSTRRGTVCVVPREEFQTKCIAAWSFWQHCASLVFTTFFNSCAASAGHLPRNLLSPTASIANFGQCGAVPMAKCKICVTGSEVCSSHRQK